VRIAVVGSGISGQGAALALHGLPDVDVTLFEQDPRAGGHANTLTLNVAGGTRAVDTGFIVYNDDNYPNFRRFLDWSGVVTQPSDMSFALSLDEGAYEWAGCQKRTLSAFFAQRRNAVSIAHWRLLAEIVKFQRVARQAVSSNSVPGETLARYLDQAGFSESLRERYLLPMGAAIWSMTRDEMLEFPAASFLTFFDNHRLLHWSRPQWRTVTGGSRNYVARTAEVLRDRLVVNRRIVSIIRDQDCVRLADRGGAELIFDRAVVATSAPRALALLDNPSPRERDILGAFRVSANRAVVHTDARLMPRSRPAWASWNVVASSSQRAATVTYWMNRLQNLPPEPDIFVSLNPHVLPQPGTVLAQIDYEHPLYDAAAIAAQAGLASIQGPLVTFAGAWSGYGFHEDGLRSGLAAASAFGGIAPWERT
jgi:predicted NAD/FAD-binding protein